MKKVFTLYKIISVIFLWKKFHIKYIIIFTYGNKILGSNELYLKYRGSKNDK
ncbi:MAG: hypothetical protein ACI8WT_000742 [Clostridium sp.]|jgi:hypothetical protein